MKRHISKHKLTASALPGISKERQQAYENRFDLGAMFEFSNVINSSLDLKFILGHLLLTIMGKLLSLRGIVLLAKDGSTFVVQNVKGLPSSLIGSEVVVPNIRQELIDINRSRSKGKVRWDFFRAHSIQLLIPLSVRGKVLGIVGFAESLKKGKLSSKEETYVKSLSNIAAAAIEKGLIVQELRDVNRRLDGKMQGLNTLFELSKAFNGVLDDERVIKLLMYSIMGHVGVSRYVFFLQRQGVLEVVTARLHRECPPALALQLGKIKHPVLVEDITGKRDAMLRLNLEALDLHALIPLQLQQETAGIIGLGQKLNAQPYSDADLEFLSSVGNLAIISLENARLFDEAIEKQKMEDELLLAKEIQAGLLPETLPKIPHFDLAALNISSKYVGGDYYDCIQIREDQYVIAIGDVSGKGAPASLLMANFQATIRALVPLGLSLSELTRRVNDRMCENTRSDRFITFFWGILDATERTFTYVSAGHNPPFLLRKSGSIERLDKGGIILGIMKTVVPYEEGLVELKKGDLLLLFTDGVSEAMSAGGEELGEEELERLAVAGSTGSAKSLLKSIVDRVQVHSKDAPQSDDITLVIVKALE